MSAPQAPPGNREAAVPALPAAPTAVRRLGPGWWTGWSMLGLAGAVAALLRVFPPGKYTVLPPCTLHELTGTYCAGCGGTRALGALARGDLGQALAYNVVAVIFVPTYLLIAVNLIWMGWRGRPLVQVAVPRYAGLILFALLLLYSIVRNLPVAPFSFLAPHDL